MSTSGDEESSPMAAQLTPHQALDALQGLLSDLRLTAAPGSINQPAVLKYIGKINDEAQPLIDIVRKGLPA